MRIVWNQRNVFRQKNLRLQLLQTAEWKMLSNLLIETERFTTHVNVNTKYAQRTKNKYMTDSTTRKWRGREHISGTWKNNFILYSKTRYSFIFDIHVRSCNGEDDKIHIVIGGWDEHFAQPFVRCIKNTEIISHLYASCNVVKTQSISLNFHYMEYILWMNIL